MQPIHVRFLRRLSFGPESSAVSLALRHSEKGLRSRDEALKNGEDQTRAKSGEEWDKEQNYVRRLERVWWRFPFHRIQPRYKQIKLQLARYFPVAFIGEAHD